MYFSDLLRGLLRRWYVIVAGLLLAGGGAYLVFDAVPVRYEANATMMLLPPEESLGVEGSNPYLILGGMGQALAVLTTRLNAPVTRDALLGDDDETDYGVTADTTTGAPFLEITTQTVTEHDALAVIAEVQEAARAELERMQVELEIPAESIIGIMDVAADIEATRLSSTRMQLTLATATVGAVLTIVVAAVADGLLAVRRRRRVAANAPTPREREAYEPLAATEVLAQDESTQKGWSMRKTSRRRSRVDEARENDADEHDVSDGSDIDAEHRAGEHGGWADVADEHEPAIETAQTHQAEQDTEGHEQEHEQDAQEDDEVNESGEQERSSSIGTQPGSGVIGAPRR
ncbi:hypothetical protein [Microbacterium sp. 18062]|uniref:hypothetical protein n=1 Tax=Microbacterium sp. 18062 TaxID=2681410 RepID=UPI0013573E78|nr:hypothetical protein [Microbacterium sp. 18062]